MRLSWKLMALTPAMAMIVAFPMAAPARASGVTICGSGYSITKSVPIDVDVAGVIRRVGSAYLAKYTNEEGTRSCEFAQFDFSDLPSAGHFTAIISQRLSPGEYSSLGSGAGSFTPSQQIITTQAFRYGSIGDDRLRFRVSIAGTHTPAPQTIVVPKSKAKKAAAKKSYKKALKKASKIKSHKKRNRARSAAEKRYRIKIAPNYKNPPQAPQPFSGTVEYSY